MFVLWFWVISKASNLPAALDYVVAPGMFPTALYSDGVPPKPVVIIFLIINFGLYVSLSYVALSIFARWQARRLKTETDDS